MSLKTDTQARIEALRWAAKEARWKAENWRFAAKGTRVEEVAARTSYISGAKEMETSAAILTALADEIEQEAKEA